MKWTGDEKGFVCCPQGLCRIWLLITGNDNGVTVGTFRSRLFDLQGSERLFAPPTTAGFCWKVETIQRHQEEKVHTFKLKQGR